MWKEICIKIELVQTHEMAFDQEKWQEIEILDKLKRALLHLEDLEGSCVTITISFLKNLFP